MSDQTAKWDYSLHYKKWHQDTDEHFAAQVLFYRQILGPILAEIPVHSKILDFGCGQGLLVNALNVWGYSEVVGVDISPEQISVARQRGLNCRLVEADDVYSMSPKQSYDAIFLLDVLEHVPVHQQMRFVHALSELLVPNGNLVITVPNANSSFASRWRYIDWTYSSSFTEHSIEFVLLNQGFSRVRYFPYEFMTAPRYPFIPRYAVAKWLLHKLFRTLRRIEARLELGSEGKKIHLSLNLLLTCVRTNADL